MKLSKNIFQIFPPESQEKVYFNYN